ncbi:hypothetical protein O6H91_02G070100 [Diphasiastrum complanatum]|uniref:Uncharacterized protein n=1 Tax=Diphasiastrum complanatum TaxID=34168 RepID=A0ACC2EGP3_DIPCM|nr:hypothetical protein O6H91_Y401200 [Diphasiastrum complanatum]KAJ7565668.1 hypothetical protein O6H91_02G070100 [Diphasiastrum complanatum]
MYTGHVSIILSVISGSIPSKSLITTSKKIQRNEIMKHRLGRDDVCDSACRSILARYDPATRSCIHYIIYVDRSKEACSADRCRLCYAAKISTLFVSITQRRLPPLIDADMRHRYYRAEISTLFMSITQRRLAPLMTQTCAIMQQKSQHYLWRSIKTCSAYRCRHASSLLCSKNLSIIYVDQSKQAFYADRCRHASSLLYRYYAAEMSTLFVSTIKEGLLADMICVIAIMQQKSQHYLCQSIKEGLLADMRCVIALMQQKSEKD